MSLKRAVTKRMKKSEAPASPLGRSQSVKMPSTHFDRNQISLPVALLSTTNMLSYNAPDLPKQRHVSSSTASTHSSADESDHSVSTARSRASTINSAVTDASSVDTSPTSPKPNHLSGYFPTPAKGLRKSASTTSLQQVKEETVDFTATPAIPQRAISHSKRAHERLAAKRSMQTMNAHSSTSTRGSQQRSSIDMFSGTIQEEQAHPFDSELKQLNEIVEEFGGVVRDAELEADLTVMRKRNLATFCATDYLKEIQPLFSARFGIPQQAAPMAWI